MKTHRCPRRKPHSPQLHLSAQIANGKRDREGGESSDQTVIFYMTKPQLAAAKRQQSDKDGNAAFCRSAKQLCKQQHRSHIENTRGHAQQSNSVLWRPTGKS